MKGIQKHMRENILLIMADQMHKYALGAVSAFVQTPYLDSLADSGTLFTNAYTNNPVCGPFRGILYSGLYSKDCGVQDNCQALRKEEITFPLELGREGYETSFVGKLHLGATGNKPVPKVFWAGHKHFLGYQCYNGYKNNVYFYDEEGNARCFQKHRTDVTADLGIERLRMLAKEKKPFVQTIFFQAPHYPEQPSQQYERLYEKTVFPLPEQYQSIEPYTPTFSPYSPRPYEKCPDYRRYGGDIQTYLKLYYAMVSQIDANVGRILKELKNLGLEDSTTIIFSADHGDMQGSHGEKNKCLPFERSCGIPLIIKIPGEKQVKKVEIPVSSVDYYPTIMELAGLKSVKKLSGQSLLPLIRGTAKDHIPVFAENHLLQRTWYMWRNRRYKLVADGKTRQPIYLFDMESDEEESSNLVEHPFYKEILTDMLSQLNAEIGDYEYCD